MNLKVMKVNVFSFLLKRCHWRQPYLLFITVEFLTQVAEVIYARAESVAYKPDQTSSAFPRHTHTHTPLARKQHHLFSAHQFCPAPFIRHDRAFRKAKGRRNSPVLSFSFLLSPPFSISRSIYALPYFLYLSCLFFFIGVLQASKRYLPNRIGPSCLFFAFFFADWGVIEFMLIIRILGRECFLIDWNNH